MANRYYHPELDGDELLLGAELASHLTRALRLGAGDRLQLFDGKGMEAGAEIIELRGQGLLVRVLERRVGKRQALRMLDLAFCPPKGRRVERILQSGTELGIAAFHPIVGERSTKEQRQRGHAGERWQRIVEAACAQCGRTHLPQISASKGLETFVAEILNDFSGEKWLATMTVTNETTPQSSQGTQSTENTAATKYPPAIVVVGPEGDFSPAEKKLLLGSGCAPLDLGPLVLRIETAAIVASASLLLWPPSWPQKQPGP